MRPGRNIAGAAEGTSWARRAKFQQFCLRPSSLMDGPVIKFE